LARAIGRPAAAVNDEGTAKSPKGWEGQLPGNKGGPCAVPGLAVKKSDTSRGGARVIYFNRLECGEIWLLMVYVKAKFDNLLAPFLNQLREAIEHG
jgi:hypothetical protein